MQVINLSISVNCHNGPIIAEFSIRARSGAQRVRKSGDLCIQEILVRTKSFVRTSSNTSCGQG